MKKSLKKSIAFIGCIALFSSSTFGQCKNFLKKADLSVMKSYEHCGNVRMAKMYSGDEATLAQNIESTKRYRLLTIADKRLGEIEVLVTNNNGDTVGVKVNENNQEYWEVLLEKSQIIQIKLSATDEFNATRINVSGCVALIIGELRNEELVLAD